MPSSTATPATLPPAGELRISLSEVESDASSSSGRTTKRRKKKKSKPSPPDCGFQVLDNLTNLLTETHSAASASSSTTPTSKTWYDRSPLKTTKKRLLKLKSLLHKAITAKNLTELQNHDLYINSRLDELLEGTEFIKDRREKEGDEYFYVHHKSEEVFIWVAGEAAYKHPFEAFIKERRGNYDELCDYLEHLE